MEGRKIKKMEEKERKGGEMKANRVYYSRPNREV
jgi:hypothetical protein